MLVLRRRLLNEAEQFYSAAIQTRRIAEAQLQERVSDIETLNDRVVAARGEVVSGYQQQSHIGALGQAHLSLAGIKQQVEKALSEEQDAKMKYIEANKNHELLLKLQEKQHSAHLQDELLKEQSLQDDLFNARRSMMNAVG